MRKILITTVLFFIAASSSYAAVIVPIYSVQADHKKIGQITFKNKSNGLLIITDLKHLSPGEHGFHIHDKPSCDNKGMAAGGHFDPKNSLKHQGPYNTTGHQGDLPKLIANKKGVAKDRLFAPNLQLNDLYDHAVIIHAEGDNYSDVPKPLGGGGERIACGIIKK